MTVPVFFSTDDVKKTQFKRGRRAFFLSAFAVFISSLFFLFVAEINTLVGTNFDGDEARPNKSTRVTRQNKRTRQYVQGTFILWRFCSQA